MKRIRLTLTAVLSDLWFSQEEIEELTDEEIMETVMEDVLAVVQEGTWKMERIQSCRVCSRPAERDGVCLYHGSEMAS